ncbi:MAG: HAMP domain-containing histidine kinase [Ruminococcus sp.]|nr:HAMP domain-containing histidine kinase [Ruminococcus sp.]
MRVYYRLVALTLIIAFIIAAAVNISLREGCKSYADGQYKVDISRVEHELKENGAAGSHPTITGVYEYDGSGDFYSPGSEYVIREINGKVYRIDYNNEAYDIRRSIIKADIALAGMTLLILVVLLYIGIRIIRPFNRIRKLPEELARGNLNVPLTETKGKFFGKFIWGLDMLREKLENSQKSKLMQARSEKTMLLSLSHDIKTPLSAIKLYAGALSHGLYPDPEKQRSAAENISVKADDISSYIDELISSLSDGFMELTVENTEFYLSTVMDRIIRYYRDKLDAASAGFTVGEIRDCLIAGDPDRLEETLQNVIENAIKYGDGKDITISSSDEEDCRLITVSNTGCTLPSGELPHIFESFWRGSNSEGKPGSGLGLYICRKLMNSAGGDIFAETEDGIMKVTVVCRKAIGGAV